VTRLQDKAQFCNFTSIDSEMKQQIIQGCASDELRKKLLSNPSLNLAEIMTTAITDESVDQQIHAFKQNSDRVNAVKTRPGYASRREAIQQHHERTYRNEPRTVTFKQSSSTETCYNCGGTYPHLKPRICPAKGKTCSFCGKLNHFAEVCRQKAQQSLSPNPLSSINRLQTEPFDEVYEPLLAWGINVNSASQRIPRTSVSIGQSTVEFYVDTGAECNVMDSCTYDRIRDRPTLTRCSSNIVAYGSSTPMQVRGEFNSKIHSKNGNSTTARFIVSQGKFGNLLSYDTALQLGIINRIANVSSSDVKSSLVHRFPLLFTAKVGRITNVKAMLHVDKTVKPVFQSLRPHPFYLIPLIEAELEKMVEADIISRTYGPLKWLSNIYPVPKPGSPDQIRITIDMRAANTAILRERHPIRRVEELFVILNGAKYFSKLDMNKAYNQIELEESCKYITAFIAPSGTYWWNRLNLGTCASSEIFEKIMQEILVGLPGVISFADDILIWGSSLAEHDTRLNSVLHVLQERGATLNIDKCLISVTDMEFFGLRISDKGISISEDKLKALLEAPAPKSSGEVLSFLGLVIFCERFITNLATIVEPMRRLTKAKEPWFWGSEQQASFENLKANIIRHALAFFDLGKRTKLTVDASPVGAGAILSQYDPKVPDVEELNASASHKFTEIQQRYSQCERESVAIVWACEKFRTYLIGCEFDLYTDNRAAQAIFSNPHSNPSARIRRLTLRMLPFKCRIFYTKGDGNIADYLSRNPIENTCCEHERLAEEYIYMATISSQPSAISRSELIQSTAADPNLSAAISAINTGTKLKDSAMNQLLQEMSVSSDGLLLRDTRIVIPSNMTQRIIDIAHSAHQGMSKTKDLIRRHVWFPKLNELVEKTVRSCNICQANTDTSSINPIIVTPLPDGPWEEIDIDFFGPIPTGHYKMVMIDRYSRYVIVKDLARINAESVIKAVDDVCADFGYMRILKSDNGPPFKSYAFSQWCKDSGITHRRITPYWPRANGMAERFMKPLAKAIRVNGRFSPHYELEIKTFTRSYNDTPHLATGYAPRDLIYRSRTSSTRLPVFHTPKVENEVHSLVYENDQHAKESSKRYSDVRLHVRPHDFEVGQSVLKRQIRKLKSDSPFDPVPFLVTDVNGTMITISRNGTSYCRNSSELKHYTGPSHGSANSRTYLNQSPFTFMDIDELFDLVPDPIVESTSTATSSDTQRQRFAGIVASSPPQPTRAERTSAVREACRHCSVSYKAGAGIASHERRCQPASTR